MTLGALIIDTPHVIRIQAFSTGDGLVFDNGAATASITRAGTADTALNVNMRLASDLRIDTGDPGAEMFFSRRISESGGSRSIVFAGQGTATFDLNATNTLTGSTTVLGGTVALGNGPGIPGDLIVGDDVGDPGRRGSRAAVAPLAVGSCESFAMARSTSAVGESAPPPATTSTSS